VIVCHLKRKKKPMPRCKTVSLLLLLILGVVAPALAQTNPDGWTTYQLNMRAGPDPGQPVITVLTAGTGLIFDARSADLSWLLAHTLDGVYRGWVASLYVGYNEGFGSPSHLPVSGEIVHTQPAPAADPAAPADEPDSGTGMDLDPATVQVLASVPIIPAVGPRLYEIFRRGQALGNNPHIFSQVGEFNTMSQALMVPFATGAYDLGPYSSLQSTIDFFQAAPVAGVANSFWYKGVAMTTGLTSLAVIDPSFSNPALCAPGQSLLECEYERSKPAVALINLGLYDVYWLTPQQYESAMRRIIEISMDRGVIPVLTTFPTYPGDVSNWPNESAARYQNRAIFNRTVINLGREYGVPVMNLWRATSPLDWHGLRPGDYQHLFEPPGFFVAFNGEEDYYGFTMWNLVALQTLDVLRASLLQ
jgi:hypothetical protein